MNNWGRAILSCSVFLFCFLAPKSIFAQEKFITIVNPVRISSYTLDREASLKAQASIVLSHEFSATWLLSFDALSDGNIKNIVSNFPKNQEIGLFLEVSEPLAKKAGVEYQKPDHWYFPNALFLSGYTQEQRKKLIDTLFSSFKETFGYYPVSVGSWWTDSFSLSYMQKQYGITATLNCSDQFSTDNYQLWGQYWGAPFYPSRIHAGIPALEDNKIDVVEMQWAYRDPLNGYTSSLFSTQDYFVTDKKLDTTYFEKLLNVYLLQGDNPFGQVVVGLESDLDSSVYEGEYKNQLAVVKQFVNQKGVSVKSMAEFSIWYKDHFQKTAPMHFVSNDLLGGSETVEWYESAFYRLAMRYTEGQSVTIFDWRVYPNGFREPYDQSPNRDLRLSIVTPSIIDSGMNKAGKWQTNLSRNEITMQENSIRLSKQVSIPEFISQSPLIEISTEGEQLKIKSKDWPYESFGKVVRATTPETKSLLSSTKVKILGVVFLITIFLLIKYRFRKILIGIFLLVTILFFTKMTTLFLVTPGELQGLLVLKSLPQGAVLVPNKECLQCEYHTSYKPLVFTNNREYVAALSGKKIIYDTNVLNASREQIREAFLNTNATYIYLTQIEKYKEQLLFSPGDIGITKIFGNANVEIWKKN